MNLFKKTGKAKEKWRTKARMIDLHKTKVTLLCATKPKPQPEHLPQWIYERLRITLPYEQNNLNNPKDNRPPIQGVCVEKLSTDHFNSNRTKKTLRLKRQEKETTIGEGATIAMSKRLTICRINQEKGEATEKWQGNLTFYRSLLRDSFSCRYSSS